MKKFLSEILNQNCLFSTSRVSVLNWSFVESQAKFKNNLTQRVSEIMTPNVTKALPDDWQNLDTTDKVENWIYERIMDSNFYAITLTKSKEIIGFLFLYSENETVEYFELRLGYLLTESIWGKGIGSELIKGLVDWCDSTGIIKSISGGVEKDNLG